MDFFSLLKNCPPTDYITLRFIFLFSSHGSKECIYGFSRMKEERECMEIREWGV